ncbi:MAG TPA: hypothetical protein VK907_09130, partial [Phnomibacter sp.]|nr:hypothetical protein [Phnomibacter sp.]
VRMENEQQFSEKESLRLITEMIQQAKAGYYHDSGIGPILWGTVVSIAGFMTFFTLHFNWDIEFDWWLLVLLALIPQYFISKMERSQKVVKTHVGRALDMVWLVYGISIFAILFYVQVAPGMTSKFMEESNTILLRKDLISGEISEYQFGMAHSPGSLLLLMFAFPTIITGVVQRQWPMIIGALVTYLFFIISIYTRNPIDQLMMGTAGLINWLIPGLILRKKYMAQRSPAHV